MIVVFVVDTSPSMARPIGPSSSSSSSTSSEPAKHSGMSRLDLAKMAVEDLSRRLRKGGLEHNSNFVVDPVTKQGTATQRSVSNLGQGAVRQDALLLLSTSRQHPDTASCAAGGRLLVGFGRDSPSETVEAIDPVPPHQQLESFQRELKRLKAADWSPHPVSDGKPAPFPEDAGGAAGLNAALSTGLQLLSRYRLQNRCTENFGMGRIPNIAVPAGGSAAGGGSGGMNATASNNAPATSALQPACLILVTDGACLRANASAGGGTLQLQYGKSQPLREFYREPFRWDQRIFCLTIGGSDESASSSPKGGGAGSFLPPQLRALCEVTGGSYWLIRKPSSLPTEILWKHIRPPLPKTLPLPDPLYLRLSPGQQLPSTPASSASLLVPPGLSFVNGGPVCCFQAFEGDEQEQRGAQVQRRAMLLYTGSVATTVAIGSGGALSAGDSSQQRQDALLSQPLWIIPESYFPSKKLDTLPPRSAQPLLMYSKYPSNLGSKSFDPMQVIKMLHRLDYLIITNRKLIGQAQPRCLHRDVYACEWLSPEGGGSGNSSSTMKPTEVSLSSNPRQEYFPVFCPGAGRPTMSSDDSDNYLNIGILHAPHGSTSLSNPSGVDTSRIATLTLLPPEPHILLPLLIRAAEAEHRLLKKHADHGNKFQKILVPLDEHWRSEFQAYTFRIPPYYQPALKRSLRHVLPASAHTLLHADAIDSLQLQCMSKACLQKIRNAEQIARDTNERLERQEASLRAHNFSQPQQQLAHDQSRNQKKDEKLRYGQFDPNSSVDSYLAAIRSMPPPWRVAGVSSSRQGGNTKQDLKNDAASMISENKEADSPRSVVDTLGDLPAECLMAYYESRRRWIFGGPSLTTRGLHVEGVSNDGSNSHRCGRTSRDREECLLSLAGIGVSMMNETSTTKMGDYRERLLFARTPVVGYGSNDAAGVAATTAADGSPVWSVDDDAMPTTFFHPKTGEFSDSVQARVRSKLMVNFGNPYKEKRADSLVPEKYYSQLPSTHQRGISVMGSPPPGSPPHDSFDSVEEGEAIFVRTSPSRSSPKREEPDEPSISQPPAKRPRSDSREDVSSVSASPEPPKPPVPADALKPPPPRSRSTSIKPPDSKPPPPRTKSSVEAPKPPTPRAKSVPAPPPPKTDNGVPPPGKAAPTKPGPPPKTKGPPPPRPPKPPPKTGSASRPHGAPPPPPKTSQKVETAARPPAPESAQKVPPVPAPPVPESGSITPDQEQQQEQQLQQQEQQQQQLLQQQKGDAPAPASAPAETLDLQSPDKKPAVNLPQGWICVWSKSQRRWYFFDTKSNKSVWTWPPT